MKEEPEHWRYPERQSCPVYRACSKHVADELSAWSMALKVKLAIHRYDARCTEAYALDAFEQGVVAATKDVRKYAQKALQMRARTVWRPGEYHAAISDLWSQLQRLDGVGRERADAIPSVPFFSGLWWTGLTSEVVVEGNVPDRNVPMTYAEYCDLADGIVAEHSGDQNRFSGLLTRAAFENFIAPESSEVALCTLDPFALDGACVTSKDCPVLGRYLKVIKVVCNTYLQEGSALRVRGRKPDMAFNRVFDELAALWESEVGTHIRPENTRASAFFGDLQLISSILSELSFAYHAERWVSGAREVHFDQFS